jgi:serine/threonine protein kinase
MAVVKRKELSTKQELDGFDHSALLDDNYQLAEVIGRGGNSVVYLAYPTPKRQDELYLPQKVTIKVFNDGVSNPELIERIQREAMCLKTISSERVIKIFEYSASMESSYLVLEYAEHGDIKSLMERLGKLEVSQALRFGIQLLAAVEAVHAAGIIHRDIKPENLLIGFDGTVKLSDFGVSTFISGDSSQVDAATVVRGTLGYIAPEQLAGEAETFQSDVFASAVTIFEMLTNRLPFEAISLNDLLDKMLRGELLSLTNIIGKEYEKVEEVLYKSLSPIPSERHSSIIELRRELEKAIWSIEENRKRSTDKSDVKRLTPVTLATSNSVEKWAKNHTKKKHRSLKLIVAASILMGLGVLLSVRDYAAANSRKVVGTELHALDTDSFFSYFFGQTSAFEQVKPLTENEHRGLLYNLLSDGQNVSFTTKPVPGVKNAFQINLDLQGWQPKIVTLSEGSKSRELIISSGGLKLSLKVDRTTREQDAIVSGHLKDLKSGRESRWAAF